LIARIAGYSRLRRQELGLVRHALVTNAWQLVAHWHELLVNSACVGRLLPATQCWPQGVWYMGVLHMHDGACHMGIWHCACYSRVTTT
jgi:hypothetical protein